MPQDLTTKASAIRESVKQLLGFILDESDFIEMTLDHFPMPNEKLKMPAVTVDAQKPEYTPLMSYVIAKTDPVNVSDDPDVVIMQSTVTKVTGLYDFRFQLDIWTSYKPQRDSLVEEVIDIFNRDERSHGINLALSNYFGEFCHYSVGDIRYPNDEASSQRGEWRATLTVLATVRCVRQEVKNLMQTIENRLETPTSIAPPESDEDPGEPII